MQAVTRSKTVPRSLMEPIEANARLMPNAPALIYPSLTLSYRELVELVNFICLRLAEAGIFPSQTLAITTESPALKLLQILSLSKLGCSFLLLDKSPLSHEQTFFNTFLVDKAGYTSGAFREIVFKPDWLTGRTSVLHNAVARGFGSQKEPMMLLTTSGTTGRPKSFVESAELFCRRVWHRMLAYGGPEGFGHSSILFGMGSSIGNMRFSVLWEGGTLVDTSGCSISTHAARCLDIQTLAGSVMQLKTQADLVGAGKISFPKLNKVIVAGSKMSPKMFDYFREKLCPNVIIGYGSSEVGLVAKYAIEDAKFHPNSVGAIVPWCKVEIVDENDMVLPHEEEGIVRIKSPDAVLGYASASDDDGQLFRNGWFYPGDIGSITKRGHLLISGRTNEVINLGGSKIDPSVIEGKLLEHDIISDAAAFALVDTSGIDHVCVAIVSNGYIGRDELTNIHRHLPRKLRPSRIFVVEKIPRNDMGKIVRRELQKKYGPITN